MLVWVRDVFLQRVGIEGSLLPLPLLRPSRYNAGLFGQPWLSEDLAIQPRSDEQKRKDPISDRYNYLARIPAALLDYRWAVVDVGPHRRRTHLVGVEYAGQRMCTLRELLLSSKPSAQTGG